MMLNHRSWVQYHGIGTQIHHAMLSKPQTDIYDTYSVVISLQLPPLQATTESLASLPCEEDGGPELKPRWRDR